MEIIIEVNVNSLQRDFFFFIIDPRLITVLSVSGSVAIILVLSLGLCCAIQ